MELNEILSVSKIKPEVQGEIRSFLTLCDHLNSLTEVENDALLSEKGLKDRQLAYKKVVLLEEFEERVSKVFSSVINEAPENLALQAHLVERVQAFQKMLKINTDLHLHAMRESPVYEGSKCITCH